MRSLLLTLLMTACGGAKSTGDGAHTGGETGGETGGAQETGQTDTDDSAETGVASLNGSPPEEAIPLPDFHATNRDNTGRGPEDLKDRPTVMWFYPAASTSG